MPQSQSLPLESIGTPVSIQTAFSTTIRTHTGSARSIGVIGLEAHLQLLTSPLKVDNSAPPEKSCLKCHVCTSSPVQRKKLKSLHNYMLPAFLSRHPLYSGERSACVFSKNGMRAHSFGQTGLHNHCSVQAYCKKLWVKGSTGGSLTARAGLQASWGCGRLEQ